MLNNRLPLLFLLACIILTTCKKVEKVMMVTTGAVSNISTISAEVTGKCIDLGEGATKQGHCYSKTSNVTVSSSIKPLDVAARTGDFSSQLTNLEPGTNYYIKAYISDGIETKYGNEISFTTLSIIQPISTAIVVENATPSVLEITYNLTLANIVPAASAFIVLVNSVARTVATVVISGTKVQLTLASPIIFGDVVTLTYTKPASNPLQIASGLQAETIIAQTVTNNVSPANPVYVSSVVENATPTLLEMTYNLTLANIVPSSSAFTVQVNSVARTVNTIAISGTKVQLTLASAVIYGDVVTVTYSKPVTNPLQTASGGQAATIVTQTVTNNVSPVNPVYISSVVENATPTLLEMTYNLTLANIVPSASVFTVQVNSVARTVNTIAISGTKVQLTLASAVIYGDVVTVTYSKPVTNPLQTASGGQAATIVTQTVTNNVSPVNPVYISSVVENVTPTLLEMTYNLTLANIVPSASVFTVQVNSLTRSVNIVSISGTKVTLTLASAILYGDIVTVAYTKPASNPLQTVSGGQAATISAQPVTNATLCTMPSANSNAATLVTNITAILNGSVNAAGCNTTVTFEYGLTTSYGLTSTAVQSPVSGTSFTGVSVGLTGLISGQTYHFRVKAVSGGGSAYGGDNVFTTTVIDGNGNVYNTVPIGTQVWLKENLKTTKYNDGTSIPNITDNTTWAGLTSPAFCWYNNDEATYKATYGTLYNWYTVDVASNGGKNACPAGWHVPYDVEWTTLMNFLGGLSVSGGKLKEAGTSHWISPNNGATNVSGFTALPGGIRHSDGVFDFIGTIIQFWSTTEEITTKAWNYVLENVLANSYRESDFKWMGQSIRCVRD